MKIVEIKVYKFDELSKEVQEKVIEDFRNESYTHLDFFEDFCHDHLREKGFNNIDLIYSLSYCPGDGLSFSSDFNHDNLKQMFIDVLGKHKSRTADIIASYCDVGLNYNAGHYCYARRQDVDIILDGFDYPNIERIIDKVRTELEDLYMGECSYLQDKGYEELKYQQSDEYIIETIRANDYDFTEDGVIF